MLTKWRQAIEARYEQLDVELLHAMGALGVDKSKGGEKAPPMKIVSTATQLSLFPCVIECGSSFFCLPGRQTATAKEKESQKE
jgi:hypothetical protein